MLMHFKWKLVWNTNQITCLKKMPGNWEDEIPPQENHSSTTTATKTTGSEKQCMQSVVKQRPFLEGKANAISTYTMACSLCNELLTSSHALCTSLM